MKTPNAVEDVEQQALSHVAGGIQNDTVMLEDILEVS